MSKYPVDINFESPPCVYDANHIVYQFNILHFWSYPFPGLHGRLLHMIDISLLFLCYFPCVLFYRSEKLLSMQDSLVLFGDTNYRYTASGHLRHSADDSGFKFENQKQYDQVGNGMEKFVQLAMKEDYGLKEVRVTRWLLTNHCLCVFVLLCHWLMLPQFSLYSISCVKKGM